MSKKLRSFIISQWIIWTLALSFFTIMRNFGHEVVEDLVIDFKSQAILHVLLGAVAGVLFGSFTYYFEEKVYKRIPFKRIMIYGSISYLLSIVVLIIAGITLYTSYLGVEKTFAIYTDYLFSKEVVLLIFYFFLVGFLIDFFRQIDKRFGRGNLWKMLKGEFYDPKEDERIFMFLDLKSSTTIAESLGHIRYSRLLQDCFMDLSIVEKYGTEVYQYVGDEVVLTWDKEIGLFNSNCLRAFFDFRQRLESRKEYYMDTYGVVPEFKAGMNIGKIIVAEVGEIKSEIAYHGDTINTAARIQGKCNDVGKPILISENLRHSLQEDSNFMSLHEGDVLLRGKTRKVNIYSVELN